ncbi:MAG: MFS transporter [Bacillota bacterium]
MLQLVGLFRRLLYGQAAETSESFSLTKLNQNIRINILHGIFNVATLDMINPFTGIFAMKLGATKFQVALLSSAPAAISLLAMIPGAKFIDRQPRKKKLTFLFMLAHRIFFLIIACIPFFEPTWRAALFVAVIGIMNLPGAVSNVAWQSFIARVIPAERRAEAFAHRNRAMNLVGTILALGVGFVLDRLAFPLGYQIVFAFAFLLAMAELGIFNLIDEEAVQIYNMPEANGDNEPEGAGVNPGFKRILSEGRFVGYTLASILFYFSWQIAWPLFSWYQVKVLGANNFWMSILSLMNTGGSLVGYGFWVKVLNRYGNLKTLFYSTLPICIVPAVYAFSHSLYTIVIFNLITGAIFSGVNLALFNALLEVTPDQSKTSFIAYYNTSITVSAIVAPVAGVGLLKVMNFQWAFLTCAVLRVAGSYCFLLVNRLEERKAAG